MDNIDYYVITILGLCLMVASLAAMIIVVKVNQDPDIKDVLEEEGSNDMPNMPTDGFIFVFGSNLQGYHGGGAARDAHLHKGAQWGVGEGRTGQSYALPTKETIRVTMSLPDIASRVDTFISYAQEHPELRFQVTMVGCGLAGLSSAVIAPMFDKAPDNCWFDSKWREHLKLRSPVGFPRKFWGTF